MEKEAVNARARVQAATLLEQEKAVVAALEQKATIVRQGLGLQTPMAVGPHHRATPLQTARLPLSPTSTSSQPLFPTTVVTLGSPNAAYM